MYINSKQIFEAPGVALFLVLVCVCFFLLFAVVLLFLVAFCLLNDNYKLVKDLACAN